MTRIVGHSGFGDTAALARPLFLIFLARATDAERVGGHGLRDHRAGGDVRSGADFNGRDQSGIAADESSFADGGRVFLLSIVIAGDRAGADVDLRANLGIAE